MYKTKQASEKLGIHANTLRTWADEGKIKYIRTQAGQRLYDVADFLSTMKERKKINISNKRTAKNIKFFYIYFCFKIL